MEFIVAAVVLGLCARFALNWWGQHNFHRSDQIPLPPSEKRLREELDRCARGQQSSFGRLPSPLSGPARWVALPDDEEHLRFWDGKRLTTRTKPVPKRYPTVAETPPPPPPPQS